MQGEFKPFSHMNTRDVQENVQAVWSHNGRGQRTVCLGAQRQGVIQRDAAHDIFITARSEEQSRVD